MTKLLVIDDKLNIQKVLKIILEKEGYSVDIAGSGKEGLDKVFNSNPDLIISDIRLGDMEGTELFQIIRERGVNIPFIFITAFATVKGAVSAIKEGAVDYLTKPIDYAYLKKTISILLNQQKTVSSRSEDRFLVGSSATMKNLYQRIKTVAGTNSTILIIGESGTGKELVARTIHSQSSRKDKPFIPINCSVLNMNLLESELFGYEKGAFTGAHQQKKGVFEIAHEGTLFLDEVSEIDPAIQVKLLRVLQERNFVRVGGTTPVAIDVRLVAATNRKLEDLIEQGKFRQDLYYRLNVIPIHIPPLREHLEDLPELIEHFIIRICSREFINKPKVSISFIENLTNYSWYGNIRELENLIERILILYRPSILEKECLQSELDMFKDPINKNVSERNRIITALRLCSGNKTETCKILAIPRRTLYNKLKQYEIQKEEYSKF